MTAATTLWQSYTLHIFRVLKTDFLFNDDSCSKILSFAGLNHIYLIQIYAGIFFAFLSESRNKSGINLHFNEPAWSSEIVSVLSEPIHDHRHLSKLMSAGSAPFE